MRLADLIRKGRQLGLIEREITPPQVQLPLTA